MMLEQILVGPTANLVYLVDEGGSRWRNTFLMTRDPGSLLPFFSLGLYAAGRPICFHR